MRAEQVRYVVQHLSPEAKARVREQLGYRALACELVGRRYNTTLLEYARALLNGVQVRCPEPRRSSCRNGKVKVVA